MSAYHGMDDEFSPKKYATVSALKEFEYQMQTGHSHVHDGGPEDILYHQKSLYGDQSKDDDNPFGDLYHRKQEEDDLLKKDSGPHNEDPIDEVRGNYKKISEEEIAKTLFGEGPSTADFGHREQMLSNEELEFSQNAQRFGWKSNDDENHGHGDKSRGHHKSMDDLVRRR